MKPYNLFGLLLVVLGLMDPHPVVAQTPDSLDHYLETAAKNNPGLNADFLAYKASLEKVPQAGAWPDPRLDIGFFLKPMEIVGGRQIADFTLMQMFPWFGTKKAAQTEATHMAKKAYARFTETRDNLFLEVYTQWYLLSTLVEQLRNNRDNLQLLKQLEELALRKASSSSSGMSSGMGSAAPGMSDVLRVQLEVVEIENNIESILSAIAAEKAKFNALLNRPSDREVTLPDSITMVPFQFDEVAAMDEIERQNPTLGMLVEEELAYRARSEMDKKMSYPMIGLGLQYMLIGEHASTMQPGTDNTMGGMDMIMPMVSISLPIFRNKYRSQQLESRFQWQSAQEKYNNTLNMLQSDLFRLKHQLDDAERKIALYEKQEQLARTTYQLVIQEFVTGRSDLTNVIQVQRQLLDYQLREAEAIAEYNTRVASILKLRSFNISNN